MNIFNLPDLGEGLPDALAERATGGLATFCGRRERVAGHAEPARCLVDGECADACRRSGAADPHRDPGEDAMRIWSAGGYRCSAEPPRYCTICAGSAWMWRNWRMK